MPHLYVVIFFENLKFSNNFESFKSTLHKQPMFVNLASLWNKAFLSLITKLTLDFSQILLCQIGKLTTTSTSPPSLVC
jgi:hypothetical protein